MGIYLLMIAGAMLLIMSFEVVKWALPRFPGTLSWTGKSGKFINNGFNVLNCFL